MSEIANIRTRVSKLPFKMGHTDSENMLKMRKPAHLLSVCISVAHDACAVCNI